MKIIEILPELKIGGVERHVIDLSNELVKRGHGVLVISAGGGMASQLSGGVKQAILPVHKKNPFTIISCALKIAVMAGKNGYEVIHAHSRVPAWIAYIAASRVHIPYVVTAHGVGNKAHWIYKPHRKAFCTICVSKAVREGMKDCFYGNTAVILNGLPEPAVKWSRPKGDKVRFLFVGRLSRIKGIQDILKALPAGNKWMLDVVGDGSIIDELKRTAEERGLSGQVVFHGYSDKPDDFMAAASCLLFPSHREGMPLVLARAVQIGLPVLASNIPPVAEMAKGTDGLLPPGDTDAWRSAMEAFIKTGVSPVSIPLSSVPTLNAMVDGNEEIYRRAAESFRV